MRGKQISHSLISYGGRNIPAYAGKTMTSGTLSLILAEQPRVCGENLNKFAFDHGSLGTSPRMRGKQTYGTPHDSYQGNIPAYAGKTTGDTSDRSNNREHPRVCGENIESRGLSVCVRGTSPRMRGKLFWWENWVDFYRNIPAYAGKTIIYRWNTAKY